jgi:hypothetical protein
MLLFWLATDFGTSPTQAIRYRMAPEDNRGKAQGIAIGLRKANPSLQPRPAYLYSVERVQIHRAEKPINRQDYVSTEHHLYHWKHR